MKKILYIAVSSSTGGVPKHILNALKLNKGIYKIDVAVPSDGDYFVWFGEYANMLIDIKLKPFNIGSLLKLNKYVKNNNIQIIHSHGKGAGMYGRLIKFMQPKIKTVHTFHGIYLEKYSPVVKRLYIAIEHFLKKYTDSFICVSESEKLEAKKLGFIFENRTTVIPNGIDINLYKNDIDKNKYADEFKIPKNAYVAGCVARLEQMKGHVFLINAFEKFAAENDNSYLLLIGDGPDRIKLEQIIKEKGLQNRIILTGFRHDIAGLLKYIDVFISASLKEGMPYTLIEALAAGVPVVATDVIGNRDVIIDGNTGLLARSEDYEDIYLKLKIIKEDNTLRDEIIRNGKTAAKEKYTIEKSVGSLYEVYDRLV